MNTIYKLPFSVNTHKDIKYKYEYDLYSDFNTLDMECFWNRVSERRIQLLTRRQYSDFDVIRKQNTKTQTRSKFDS